MRADSLEEVKIMQEFTLSIACQKHISSWQDWITHETLVASEIII
jgi:hypothetical protein